MTAVAVKNRDLITDIKNAPVNLDKLCLLREANKTWTYDFTQDENYTFKPGSVNAASIWTSSMMVGTGMTVQMISLGPCEFYCTSIDFLSTTDKDEGGILPPQYVGSFTSC